MQTSSIFTLHKQQNFTSILLHKHNYCQTVIFNEPKTLNSLTLPMILSLQDNIKQWNNPENKTKVVCFKGAGDKAFCAGGDVKNLYYAKQSKDPKDRIILDQFFRQEYITDYMASQMKPIQICIYDGIVMGGGVGISIHSKIRVASEKSVFAMPECKLGFFTDVGVTYLLAKLRNNIGMYLGITGDRLKGEELYLTGIANYFVPSKKIAQLENDLKNKVSKETSEKEILQIVESYNEGSKTPHYKYEEAIKTLFDPNQSFSQFYCNLQNDKKHEEFSKRCLKFIQEASPLSVRIIFDQIKTANELDLKQHFIRDFRISQRFTEGLDFMEGIRSILIDKDNSPKWQHKSPLDVTQQEIDAYFAKLESSKELSFE